MKFALEFLACVLAGGIGAGVMNLNPYLGLFLMFGALCGLIFFATIEILDMLAKVLERIPNKR